MTDLKPFAYGYADYRTDDAGWITLSRFSPRQLEAYEKTPMFTAVSRQSAGIGLSFLTDGDEIRFFCRLTPRIDLVKAFASMTPGLLAQLKNSNDKSIRYKHDRGVKRVWLRNSIQSAIRMNVFELMIDGISATLVKAIKGEIIISFDNPDHRIHRVDLLFPLLEGVVIRDFSVSGSMKPLDSFRPRLLCLGDSITQGCLAAHPGQTYVRLLADSLGYEAINQGVAGCWHHADHLDGIEAVPEPSLITVAYGTNDWNTFSTFDEIRANIKAYYQRLNAVFPEKPIYAITPIWRADLDEGRPCGDFAGIKALIEEEAAAWPNMAVIDGLSVSPHEEAFFGDIYLHPNERGFAFMAKKLAARLERAHRFIML